MMIDSTVFIDFFRNKPEAVEYLVHVPESIHISRIVVMELVVGFKIKNKIVVLHKQLRSMQVEIIEVTTDISQQAGELFELYHHSHGLGIMDALIAATALSIHEPLVTHNTKHFSFIKELKVIIPY